MPEPLFALRELLLPWVAGLFLVTGTVLLARTRFAVFAPFRGKTSSAGARALTVATTGGLSGMASAALAVSLGGEGAIVWFVIATVLGVWVAGRERRVGSAATPSTSSGNAALALLFVALCVVFGIATTSAQLFAFAQTVAIWPSEGSSTDTARSLAPGAWTLGLGVAICALSAFRPALVRPLLQAAPFVVLAYVAVCLAVILGDVDRTVSTLERGLYRAFNPRPLLGGWVGAAVVHGILRATLTSGFGHGVTASIGEASPAKQAEGTAASLRDRPPLGLALATTLVVGLCTALVVGGDLFDRTRLPALAKADLVPLERHESRGLRPTREGQSIVLPKDTTLTDGQRYRFVLRANPRGHRFGTLRAETNEIVVPPWEIAKNVKYVVYRAAAPFAKIHGFDIRVEVHREHVEATAAQPAFLRLTPVDPEVKFDALRSTPALEGPFLVLDDFTFVGTVARAFSPDAAVGEHLAVLEDTSARTGIDPELREIFTAGFRGPYLVAEGDTTGRPPFAFVQDAPLAAAPGDRLKLRLLPPPRGAAVLAIAKTGEAVAPAWNLLEQARTVVFRHKTDPRFDYQIPVSVAFRHGRAMLTSLDPDLSFDAAAKLPHHEGPYLDLPPFDFEVEVRSSVRRGPNEAEKLALIPLHEHSEAVGPPIGATMYTPHPGELVAAGFGPVAVPEDGAAALLPGFLARFGDAGRPLGLALALLLGATSFAAWSVLALSRTQTAFGGGRRGLTALGLVGAASAAPFLATQTLGLAIEGVAVVSLAVTVARTLLASFRPHPP